MRVRTVTAAVAAASIAVATAAPLADPQHPRGVSAAVTVPAPQRASHPMPKRVSHPVPKAPAATAPSRTVQAPPAPKAKPSTPKPRKAVSKPQAPSAVYIGGYRDCTGNPQPCIDSGKGLTLYGRDVGVNILAAHNYNGYQWLSRVAVGRTVVVTSGPLAGTYRVTGHMRLNRQGGSIPSFGGADLVLQSCEGTGTGFSLLARIS